MNRHPGNIIFRRVVEANKERYRTCQADHKALLSKSIVLVIRSQSPPGRFLTRSRDGNEWVEVGDAKALQKTSQALREGSTDEEDREDVGAESEPTCPSQEEMNNEVLRRAMLESSNCRGTMNKSDVVVSSQLSKNEIRNSVGQSGVTADVPVSRNNCTIMLKDDSATIEESSSKSFRDVSSVASEEIHTGDLEAAALEEFLAPGDEAFHHISDDESLLSPYSDTDCLEALQFPNDEDVHDASFGLLPEFRLDMDHGEGEPLTDIIELNLCSSDVWEL